MDWTDLRRRLEFLNTHKSAILEEEELTVLAGVMKQAFRTLVGYELRYNDEALISYLRAGIDQLQGPGDLTIRAHPDIGEHLKETEFADALFEFRMIIEPGAARLAARKQLPEALVDLRLAIERMESTPPQSQENMDADLAIHLLDNAFGDGKTEAGPAIAPGDR